MAMPEKARSSDIDPTAGALHCIKIGEQYLLRVEERQDTQGNIGHVLLPISDISRELIPVLGRGGQYVSRAEFLACLRTGNDESGRIYDVRIRNDKVVKKIEKAVRVGNGLTLVSAGQILDGNAIPITGGEAIVAADCRRLVTPRVSTEQYRLPEEVESKLYARAKKFIYSLEEKGGVEDYRLKEKDIKLLREKCSKVELVDDLERILVAKRLTIAGIKLARSLDEGLMVGAGKFEHPIVKLAARLVSIGVLIGTHVTQSMVEKRTVHTVSAALRKVLHNIVEVHGKEALAYGWTNHSGSGESLHERASFIADKLGKVEQIAPFVTEMAPGLLATSAVLGMTEEFTPLILNWVFAAGAYAALRFKFLGELFSESAAGVAADIPAVISSVAPIFSETVEEGSLLVTALALTGGHASTQLGSIFEIDHGREALGELRNWLGWLDISLVSDQAKRDHSLRILATQNTGMVFESIVNGKRVRRYSDIDRERKRKNIKETEPLLLIEDLTVTEGEKVFVENMHTILRPGLNVLYAPRGSGKTAILECLAGGRFHPTGKLLLRLEETDKDLHGESDEEMVNYINCSGEKENGLPDFLGHGVQEDIDGYQDKWNDPQNSLREKLEQTLNAKYFQDDKKLREAYAVASYLKLTELLSDKEIIDFFAGGKNLNHSARARLWAAYAGWGKARVVLLDNVPSMAVLENFDQRLIDLRKEIVEFLDHADSPEFPIEQLRAEAQVLHDTFVMPPPPVDLVTPSDINYLTTIFREEFWKINTPYSIYAFLKSNLFRHVNGRSVPIIVMSSSDDLIVNRFFRGVYRISLRDKRLFTGEFL